MTGWREAAIEKARSKVGFDRGVIGVWYGSARGQLWVNIGYCLTLLP